MRKLITLQEDIFLTTFMRLKRRILILSPEYHSMLIRFFKRKIDCIGYEYD